MCIWNGEGMFLPPPSEQEIKAAAAYVEKRMRTDRRTEEAWMQTCRHKVKRSEPI